ncbi:MAG: hypothetical protein V9G09_12195 [Candidatus Nanopelagicales bacterium]
MISGFALIDKPQGWTSHDVVGRLRRLYGQRRVGHAGTLDPMATGVLVVGLGHATRLLRFVQGQPKTYEATIRLGAGTLTDDAEGEVVATPGWEWDPAGLSTAITALTGDIQQVPSAVSAIKVDGVRSYARVRAGEEVELPAPAGQRLPLRDARVASYRGPCGGHRRRRGLQFRYVHPCAGPGPGCGRGQRRTPHCSSTDSDRPDRGGGVRGVGRGAAAGAHPHRPSCPG